MKITKQLILKTLLVLTLIVIIFLINQKDNSPKENREESQKEKYQIPSLNIDPNYFSNSEISSGSWSDEKWSSATMREGSRTQPTTNISLDEKRYDQEIIELPPIKTDNEIYIMEDNMGAETFTKQIAEYGNLARRFLPDDLIGPVEKFDVDKDGKDEQIISTCGLWGNGCPHQIVIVKDNKIIFRTGGRDIVKTDNGNGFTLIWQKEYKDPYGEMRTRFVFEDGKFKPIYEQEVKYFYVKETN